MIRLGYNIKVKTKVLTRNHSFTQIPLSIIRK